MPNTKRRNGSNSSSSAWNSAGAMLSRVTSVSAMPSMHLGAASIYVLAARRTAWFLPAILTVITVIAFTRLLGPMAIRRGDAAAQARRAATRVIGPNFRATNGHAVSPVQAHTEAMAVLQQAVQRGQLHVDERTIRLAWTLDGRELPDVLRERYCREIPLALHASIVFEQSYGGVEGDSVYQDGLDAPDNPVLPGKSVTWWMGYGVDDAADTQLTVRLGFLDYDDVIYTP